MFNPTDIQNTFINNVILWIETVTVSRQEDLITYLNQGNEYIKYTIGQDVVVKSGKDSELSSFVNGTKISAIDNSLTYPINWYTVLT